MKKNLEGLSEEKDSTKDSQKLRLDRNRELIRRMRSGESLTSFDSAASWFPPRPIIDKNQDVIRNLYGETTTPPKRKKEDESVPATQVTYLKSV